MIVPMGRQILYGETIQHACNISDCAFKRQLTKSLSLTRSLDRSLRWDQSINHIDLSIICNLQYFITFKDLSGEEMPRKYGKK